MKLSQIRAAVSCALILCGVPSGAQSLDQIVVVGSSTIYPFSVLVGAPTPSAGRYILRVGNETGIASTRLKQVLFSDARRKPPAAVLSPRQHYRKSATIKLRDR